jgi:hypothetical protein
MSSLTTILAILALATLTTALPIPGALHPRSLFSKKNALNTAGWLLICYDLLAAGLLVALWSWNRSNGRIADLRRVHEQEGIEMQELGPRDGNSSMEAERASTVDRESTVESAMRRLSMI